MPRFQRTAPAIDLLMLVAIAVVVPLLFLQRPPTLHYADEAYILYEAKRILQGEVLYRDVFEIIPPLSIWLTAVGFALFGVNISTARGLAAGLQVGLAATVYGCSRVLGVRPSLAILAAACAVALGQPLWPIVSPHWLSTLLVQLFLMSLLGLRDRSWTGRWLVPGLLLGVLATNQHQKAVPFVAAALLVIAFDVATARAGHRLRLAVRATVICGLGAIAVAGPVTLVMLATAGAEPVYNALIHFPLVDYRAANHSPWGAELFPDPTMLGWPIRALPWVIPVLAARVIVACARRAAATARAPFVLLTVTLAALGSISYYPDLIHMAFIAGVCIIGIADCLEQFLRGVTLRWPVSRWLAPLLAAAGVAWSVGRLERLAVDATTLASVHLDTRFGTVAAYPLHPHAVYYQYVQQLVDRDPDKLLFAYPWMSAFYLLTGANNPTPYQCMQPGYSPPAHVATAIAALERHAVQTVLLGEFGPQTDPAMKAYLAQSYETKMEAPKNWPPVVVLERKR